MSVSIIDIVTKTISFPQLLIIGETFDQAVMWRQFVSINKIY